MSINWRKCSKCGLSKVVDPDVTYHRFPNPGKSTVDKARAWAKFCWPDEDWSSIESLKAVHFGCKILCGRHFLSSQFIDEDRQKLCKQAVPTVTNLDYYKNQKIKQEDKEDSAEVEEDYVDFNTEVEYLSDWESLEDVSGMQEDTVDESTNTKNESFENESVEAQNESYSADTIKKEKLTPRKGLYTQSMKPNKKLQTSTPKIKITNIKSERNSMNFENYHPKNGGYSITNEIQDYANSPVLSEIVRRALSKSGVTMKKILKPKSEFEKTKKLDIKKSGVQNRKSNNPKSVIATRLRKKAETSNVQPMETKFSIKEEKDFNESQESYNSAELNDDDDVFANNDADDDDYNPSDGTGYDSDGEVKPFKDFDTKTSRSLEPVDLEQRHGLCRCCLKKGQHNVANIPEVLSCLNIHPSEDPGLSALVCGTCNKFLKQVTKFRNMVATSEVELTSRMHVLDGEVTHENDESRETMEIEVDATDADSDGLSDQEELAQKLAEPIEHNPRRARPRPPNVPSNRERLKILRENVIAIILNSTILPFTFNKDPRLINHFECMYHDARYTEFHLLRKHMKEKHPKLDKAYVISYVKLLQKGILRADVSNLTCRRCGERPTNLDDLVQHLVKKHGIKYKDLNWDPPHNILGFDLSTDEIYCSVCKKVFSTFRGLLAHMNQHYGSFLCPWCGMKFLYPDSFSKHKKAHRRIMPVKTVICDKCGLNFPTRTELENHKKNDCGPTFKIGTFKKKVAKNPTTPKRIEIEIENYDCKLCDATFANSDDFFEHRMQHLAQAKEVIHVCEICGYKVIKKNQMRRHLKRHYGIRDVVCKVCNKGFVSTTDLNLHSNTHLARFQCPFCSDVYFMSKGECSLHIKSEHRDMIPKKR